jgi:GT2 family glycosyltransferase
LLDALELQTYPRSSLEVIIVDDGSSDGTVPCVQARRASYQVSLHQQMHSGPAEARNRGVVAATSELIVFLDDDVEPDVELVDRHVAAHASRPQAVVIGPMLPPAHWPRSVWVQWEEHQLLKQYRAMELGIWSCTARQFYTGNASLRRSDFLAAGGFDSRFERAEDVELGFRLANRGLEFVFEPGARVLHFASRTFDSWCRTPYMYGRYDVIMQRDKGQKTHDAAIREFRRRNVLNRMLVSICAGHKTRLDLAVRSLKTSTRIANRLGVSRFARFGLSALFGLLYWQGVSDEIGDGQHFLHAITR